MCFHGRAASVGVMCFCPYNASSQIIYFININNNKKIQYKWKISVQPKSFHTQAENVCFFSEHFFLDKSPVFTLGKSQFPLDFETCCYVEDMLIDDAFIFFFFFICPDSPMNIILVVSGRRNWKLFLIAHSVAEELSAVVHV